MGSEMCIRDRAKHEAEAEGYDDALMLDWRGYVAEGTGANIFMLMPDGKLHTPPPDCFLNGITRQSVIELAKQRDYKIVERHIKPSEIANAREIFVTGTAAEVTPVGEIDGLTITVGEVTKSLMRDYDKLVGKIQENTASAA